MMYTIKRKEEEIDDLLNKCLEAENEGRTQFRCMTYEEGVKAGIDWLTGKDAVNPLEP